MANDDKDRKEEAKKEGRTVAYWNEELKNAKKREEGYRKKAKEAVKIYEAEDSDRIPYNILYSNTETLKAAFYNKLPRPIVSRRFKDKDPLGKISAQVISRFLSFFMDSNDQDYSDFHQMAKSAVREGLVAGRGIMRFKYEAEFEGEGEDKSVKYETVCGEEVPWDRVYFGYAKRWAKVPWMAIESFMNREELEKNFPDIEEYNKLLTITDRPDSDDEKDNPPKDIEGADLAQIFEIWDKEDRQVYFICPTHDLPLKQVDDPLRLNGFFPIPKPLTFGEKISSLVPVPLYFYYEDQALELNRITIRINRIIKALKVRGFYDSSIEGIGDVLKAEDNVLLPAGNVASLMDGRTLEKSIWIMPIEKLISVLQQLYIQRESIKSVIQELSGIADIMRGSSKASETLGAQELKTQFGGMRITPNREEVEVYLRNCLRLVAEIGFKHLSQKTLAKMTNLKIQTNEEKQQNIARFQQAVQMKQMGQQVPEPPQEVKDLLKAPTWEDILSLCKDDLLRNYKLDIETNSTVELDSSAEKKEIGEFLNALAQFLNGIMPIVQTGMIPSSAVKAVLMAVTRKYKFGVEVEDEFEKVQEPKPPEEDKAKQQEMQAKMQAEQQKLEIEKQKAQLDMQIKMAEIDMKKKEDQAKGESLQMEAQLAMLEYQMKVKELQMKESLGQQQHASKLKMMAMKEKEAAKPKEKTNATV